MTRRDDFTEMWGMLDEIHHHIEDLLTSSDAEVHELYISIADLYSQIFPTK